MKHDWGRFQFGQMSITSCRVCGIVQSMYNLDRECKGPVKVGLRSRAVQSSEARVEAACRRICKSQGTAQCAPLCLSHSSLTNTGGQCPDAVRVWGRIAEAVLEEEPSK